MSDPMRALSVTRAADFTTPDGTQVRGAMVIVADRPTASDSLIVEAMRALLTDLPQRGVVIYFAAAPEPQRVTVSIDGTTLAEYVTEELAKLQGSPGAAP